jgi:hypothetical protein
VALVKEQTCNKCGWVAFGVTRQFAEDAVKSFNEHYASLSAEQQEDFYGGRGSSIKNYECCFYCGGPYTNFRNAKLGDAPNGVTLQSIIMEDQT